MVLCEMDRGKIFDRLLRSNLAEILTLLVSMTGKWPRPVNAQTNFEEL